MKKYLLFGLLSLAFLIIIFFYQCIKFYDGKLHLVFCDVGQGDAIFIRTPGGLNMLVDGGPDDSVLNCLSKHIPFWDRHISVVILTHPHADHLNGLYQVLQQYTLSTFVTERLANDTAQYRELMSDIDKKKITKRFVVGGDMFAAHEVSFNFIGPTEAFLTATSPNGKIGEKKEFSSLETVVKYKNFSALLTGDSQVDELREGLQTFNTAHISLLQVPHHGSASGLDPQVLRTIQPALAVISVGLHNRYNHPSPFTVGFLDELGIKTLRTDRHGEVEIVSDGLKWRIL